METRIISMEPSRIGADIIKIISQVLEADGVIVYPTDTFYGLGGNAFSQKAVEKINQLKERAKPKPFPVLVSDISMAEKYLVEMPASFRELSNCFWPGPLTLILKVKLLFPEALLGPRHSLGMRQPDVSWIREFIRQAGFPLIATSANISGDKEIPNPQEVIRIFQGKVDLIVDGGKTPGGFPSTVVDLTSEIPKILREGAVSRLELKKYLPTVRLK